MDTSTLLALFSIAQNMVILLITNYVTVLQNLFIFKKGYRPVLYVGSGWQSGNNAELLDYTVTNTWEQSNLEFTLLNQKHKLNLSIGQLLLLPIPGNIPNLALFYKLSSILVFDKDLSMKSLNF